MQDDGGGCAVDQLPLVVRLPVENDLSWIVLADEIYRAEREKIITGGSRKRVLSIKHETLGNWQLVKARANYTFWGKSCYPMKWTIFSVAFSSILFTIHFVNTMV